MSDFIVGALAWLVGGVVASALISWGINKLAALELKELLKYKEKEDEE